MAAYGYLTILLCFTSNVWARRTPIISHISQMQIRDIGSHVNLDCKVHYGYDYPVLWVRLDRQNTTEALLLSTSYDLNIRDSRFSLRVEEDAGIYGAVLIKNVQETDSGLYQCQVIISETNKITADVELKVTRPRIPADPPAAHRPRVIPERFVDDGRQFAVFTCHSEGRPRDILSWYQLKGENNSQLVMKQEDRDTSTTEMSLVLNKTLTASDQDSWIFCVRRTSGAFAQRLSNRIYLNSSRVLPKENVYITVQPASGVAAFYVNTTQSFECGGSQPVDGRSFNWYIEDVPLSNNFSHAPAEKMSTNSRTRHVNLTLDLNESYHLKRIYCVQEYHMTLESEDGYYYWNYGETARSHEILLSMVSEEHLADPDNMNNDETVENVVIGSSCVIVVLVLVIIGILCRFRKQG